jgi:hypothetical protein
MTGGEPGEAPVTDADTVGLPPSIAADLVEAGTCCAFGANRGAALLARRAIEQVAVLRRVPLDRRTLAQKVAWLLGTAPQPPSFLAEARTVRDVCTAAAHGSDAVTRAEANAVVRAALVVATETLLADRPPPT